MNSVIAITAGEPAGIGADLLVALAHLPFENACLAVVADAQLLEQRAEEIATPLKIKFFNEHAPQPHIGDGTLTVVHAPLAQPAVAGHPDKNNSPGVIKQLDTAIQGCLQKRFSALVTCPINKAVICQAGITFSGHTEYLAQACRCNSVMLLEAKNLRVALATTHIPLQAVAASLSKSHLKKVLYALNRGLIRQLKIAAPRIAVCGLNPHAGEQGCLGREEIDIIAPVVAELSAQGLAVFGPLSADTAFTPRQLKSCDVVLAMYHDQGLPVIKHAAFGQIVNITLGLPFIRTSVDHGTALELAGSGRAQTASLEMAVRRAVELCERK